MDDILKLLGFGGGIAGGGLLVKNAYDRLQEIGQGARDQSRVLGTETANKAAFKPFTVRGPGGSYANTSADGDFNMTLGPQQAQLMQSMLGQASIAPNRMNRIGDMYGGLISPEMRQNTNMSDFQNPMQNSQLAYQQAGGMLSGLSQGIEGREQDVYGRIRAMQSPEEERQNLALEERLAAQGRSGLRTAQYGGSPEQLALAKAQAEGRNSASMMAMQQANAEQMQQANIGSALSGLGLQGLQGASGLATNNLNNIMGLGQAQQGAYAAAPAAGMGYMQAGFMPQAQALNMYNAGLQGANLADVGRRNAAQLYGETNMSGIGAQIAAEQGAANLIGGVGSGLLSGASGGLFDWLGLQ